MQRALPALDVRFPERVARAVVTVGGAERTAASYHAPPGRTWGVEKVRQALVFAEWLPAVSGPTILGADANTPEVDAIDLSELGPTRTRAARG